MSVQVLAFTIKYHSNPFLLHHQHRETSSSAQLNLSGRREVPAPLTQSSSVKDERRDDTRKE